MAANKLSDRIKQEKSDYEILLNQKEQDKIRAEEANRRYKKQKQRELNKTLLLRFLSFFVCLVITRIGWNFGFILNDGSLLIALFMPVLFIVGAIASVVTLIRFFKTLFDK